MDYTIKFEHVHHVYPDKTPSLKNISLEIKPGEKIAVLGHNGAGKSSLVKHINGILKPEKGIVSTCGLDTAKHDIPELSKFAAYLFQNPDDQIFCNTIHEEIEYGLKKSGISNKEIKKRVESALEITGLDKIKNQNPMDLSYSRKKMVTLAMVIAMDTPVVILDEPTSGQDKNGIENIKNIIGDLEKKGKTIISISHDIEFSIEYFERFILMKKGEIISDGNISEILNHDSKLSSAGVVLPFITELGEKIGLDNKVFSEDDFFHEITKMKTKRAYKKEI